MPHAVGTYLGSVRSIEDVRLRCVIDCEGGCWHLRTGHGLPAPRDRTLRLWVYGKGGISATRAVWELAHGQQIPNNRRAVRVCGTYDCANPDHIKALTHSEAARHIIGKWPDMTAARRAQLLRMQAGRRKFTPEQVAEARRSTESAAALARKWKCSPTSVTSIRRGLTHRDPLASWWRPDAA